MPNMSLKFSRLKSSLTVFQQKKARELRFAEWINLFFFVKLFYKMFQNMQFPNFLGYNAHFLLYCNFSYIKSKQN